MKQQINLSEEWFYAATDPLIVIDDKGKIIQVNQAWEKACLKYNLSKEWTGIGSDYFQLSRQSGNQNEIRALLAVLNKEQFTVETKQHFPAKTGDYISLSFEAIPINFDASFPDYALLLQKPTSIHSVQAISAESVLESMTEGFFLIDHQFTLFYLNDVAERIVRCRREDVIGRNLWESFPSAKSIRPLYEGYELALKDKVEVEVETFFESLDTWFRVKAYPLAIGGLAVYFQDIGKQKQAEITLTQYAYFDDLTGLPNRRNLIQEGLSFKGQEKPFSMYFINLDNLKLINTLHDYNTGNQILKMVAEKLRAMAGEQHKVGRRDGDNFIYLRCEPDYANSSQFAEKILAVFEQPFKLGNFKTIKVTASIGIAHFPHDAETLDQLVANAETAMLEAKKLKGSSYAIFNPSINEKRTRRLLIEEELTKDLHESGFHFALQPQIDGNSGQLIGAEILSRWAHPVLGELSPLEFIEVAEQAGTIIPLTYHLLTEVFKKMKEWESRYGRHIKTAVNMTPSLLSCPTFFDILTEMMEQYGILPEWIEIEITEQAEMTYSEQTLENLLRCKANGISIAIDDFGTGFSMISYLTQFPVNKIKIDKCFVQEIGKCRKTEAVLKSLIHLAKSIECELIAEGVERPEEIDFLKNNGCTVYQGYLFDKPLTIEEFETKYLQENYQFSIEY
ncbi:PAS domain S-box-containing protein/diguanylate cyclase (GGDEF)-like protein [Planomicrobium soli]|uniref:PAS domain S-box-containing protein/diguanylate cyclase (GGDEF)-like protein n=1 Tax=Planomicrobium soli TaxID=1176648 RepID=A0A2P8H3H9_9BACL|nr:bifunctional diguanylate cyclase/phosphodiesterase [Planomicrobium soli]PSL40771.1 PAS domain S-box-containing protein/diguanylate cyclase (GGDEF)-like protein [Planomicrobium soli]